MYRKTAGCSLLYFGVFVRHRHGGGSILAFAVTRDRSDVGRLVVPGQRRGQAEARANRPAVDGPAVFRSLGWQWRLFGDG